MVWISIEGCIGVGKSTIIEHLSKHIKDYKFYSEPKDEWKHILDLYYLNPTNYSLLNQLTIMNSFIDIQKNIISSDNINFITERSLYTAHNIFNKLMYDDNILTIEEYNALNKIYNRNIYNPDYIIYLYGNESICSERIKHRGDKSIDINYLSKVIHNHDICFKDKIYTYTINADNTIDNIVFEIIYIIKNIINI